MYKTRLVLLILILLVMGVTPVSAQDPQPEGPIYIVQPGDNLTLIASRFGITTEELILTNGIADANALRVGDELIIPGLTGVSGYLITQPVPFGENLISLSRKYQVPSDLLIRLNHITSQNELFAGSNLIIPQQEEGSQQINRVILGSGQSVLELALLSNTSPWEINRLNSSPNSWLPVAGEDLTLPASANLGSKALVRPVFETIGLKPLPLIQGKTSVINVQVREPSAVSGSLTGYELHFVEQEDGSQLALQGIHTMQEPGLYPLTLTASSQDGSSFTYQQMVYIQDGFYGKDPVLLVKDEFIDPAVTQPEIDWLTEITSPVTLPQQWKDIWSSPSPYSYKDCLNSRYGNRRSYNGSPYEYFHAGVDFCGGEGVQIYAPAAGKVIFAGPLAVRGNATIIDHGLGVYSGYWHQATMTVAVGDEVTSGQIIGTVGGTGRVTGAHLHWEIWVGGVQVQPLDWLEKQYP